MTHDEMIAVIQAHKDGKVIQWRDRHGGRWLDTVDNPVWAFNLNIYRVKEEPREFYVYYDVGSDAFKISSGGEANVFLVREVIE